MGRGKKVDLDIIAREVNSTRYHDVLEVYDSFIGDYRLSCLTGSHCSSAKYGTIEVALMLNNQIVKGIIHYMEYYDFARMIYEISENESNIENIFLEYYEKCKTSQK